MRTYRCCGAIAGCRRRGLEAAQRAGAFPVRRPRSRPRRLKQQRVTHPLLSAHRLHKTCTTRLLTRCTAVALYVRVRAALTAAVAARARLWRVERLTEVDVCCARLTRALARRARQTSLLEGLVLVGAHWAALAGSTVFVGLLADSAHN